MAMHRQACLFYLLYGILFQLADGKLDPGVAHRVIGLIGDLLCGRVGAPRGRAGNRGGRTEANISPKRTSHGCGGSCIFIFIFTLMVVFVVPAIHLLAGTSERSYRLHTP